uniref:Uncharacterized protein n=1 Tax=viral metagenome TaxID=1070528 RepID=A0A6C0AN61_9ZZZZ
MSDSRILTIRKSDNKNHEDIMLPLMFLGEKFGYSLKSIFRQIHSAPEIHLGVYPDTFPHTIQEYYWIKLGIPGENPWVALGKLKGDMYFLYTAFMSRPSNTFINNGHMDLWVSSRYSDIVQFAMDKAFYKEYISNTTTVK